MYSILKIEIRTSKTSRTRTLRIPRTRTLRTMSRVGQSRLSGLFNVGAAVILRVLIGYTY
jgi:hypothetical protein